MKTRNSLNETDKTSSKKKNESYKISSKHDKAKLCVKAVFLHSLQSKYMPIITNRWLVVFDIIEENRQIKNPLNAELHYIRMQLCYSFLLHDFFQL